MVEASEEVVFDEQPEISQLSPIEPAEDAT